MHRVPPCPQSRAPQGSVRARVDRIAYTVAEVAALLGKHINTVYGALRHEAW
jgi:hypothetical protein